MNLGTQYYRAPFPLDKYWDDDMAKMKDSGLNTVQLWILWAWVESEPGTFSFDDYDRLVETADKHGLEVVLSTIAEIQPYWIHREVPGSEMINHLGHKVASTNRGECHYGLTPGGCTDHPGVWERMSRFLEACVNQYAGASNLHGWDAWNELRWNVQADGFVCYCTHTLGAWRKWLDEKYNGLDNLNKAWIRRYSSWEDVQPGRKPDLPYTEMMSFEHFITLRACQHGADRYDLMKGLDPDHPVTLHGGQPSPLYAGGGNTFTLDRGNDWIYADHLDGVGCSSFPKWQGIDDADFGMRIEFVRSAARGRHIWLSELQGGRASLGFKISEPVDALSQQRWIWNGIACGADTILFWCWRDEVFGRESSGFGLDGSDGLADERLQAMSETGRLLDEHKDLIDNYTPDTPEVGVLFSPQSYYLYWAQEGRGSLAKDALTGYLRALVRSSIPYTVIEEDHLDELSNIRILFLPRIVALSDEAAASIIAWVRAGGTLVCESECGAFSPAGIYRYPEERFIQQLCGVSEIGRRQLSGKTLSVNLDSGSLDIPVNQWLTPYADEKGDVLARFDGSPVIQQVPCGQGKAILCGTYMGDEYRYNPSMDFERFIRYCVDQAGCTSRIQILEPAPDMASFIYTKHGQSQGKRVVFVFFPKEHDQARLQFEPGFIKGALTDIRTGETITPDTNELKLPAGNWRFRVLAET